MIDALVLVLAAVIVGLPGLNWLVFGILVHAAWPKPRELFLTGCVFVSLGIAIGSTLGGILGVHALVFAGTGVRLIPQGLAVYLIALALVCVSLGNLALLLVLRRLRSEGQTAHIHRRGEAEQPRFHRRHDDLPPGAI